ncbi:hypothetical protein MMC28_002229 [Mycoblastus sanguinarius]|nr:hypothetical protein [Mycoblastus sanguinarius]
MSASSKDGGSHRQIVFDKDLNYLRSEMASGKVASWVADTKAKNLEHASGIGNRSTIRKIQNGFKQKPSTTITAEHFPNLNKPKGIVSGNKDSSPPSPTAFQKADSNLREAQQHRQAAEQVFQTTEAVVRSHAWMENLPKASETIDPIIKANKRLIEERLVDMRVQQQSAQEGLFAAQKAEKEAFRARWHHAPSQPFDARQVPVIETAHKSSNPDTHICGQTNNGSSISMDMADLTQDDLSQTMDESSDAMQDDSSDDMDLSSGPEVDDIYNDTFPSENIDKGIPKVTSRPTGLEIDDGAVGPASIQRIINTLSKEMDLTSGPEMDDRSDETSYTHRMSSTPSGTSGPSSHTSAGPPNVKDSIEETSASLNVPKALSRSSSLSSQLSPAKSQTPATLIPPVETPKFTPRRNAKTKAVRFADLRPRTSIPVDIPPTILAQQSVHAAHSSRLNPFALHRDEYQLLRDHICHLHVSAYLNVRNRILRLWVRNPLVSVTAEEAAGCAQASRWLGLAEVAYEWLVRKGYINFGCIEIPDLSNERVKKHKFKRKRKTIVVIGAGMSGLGCARQLEGLFRHYRGRWTSEGDEPPSVVILEGRNRVGGRVYSHPFKDQRTGGIPEQKRSAAEMGAHIIIGFDHGNPLSMIIRGQLALHYHALKDNSTLFDVDGRLVDEDRDIMVEKLYNDVLDRASVYRHRIAAPTTVEGDKGMILAGRDPQREGGPPISVVEEQAPAPDIDVDVGEFEQVPGGMDKLTGKAHMVVGSRKKEPPAVAAEGMGWKLTPNVLAYNDLNLDFVAKASKHPTLGAAMDEAVKQYQFLLDLSPQDMRLLNWHYANLEYANAANLGKLSLAGWDQDAGNEFEGVHAQVIGGYQQVPRGILQSPSKLNLHTRKIVKRIAYNSGNSSGKGKGKIPATKVHCEDGDIFEADQVILTTPLGVLKDDTVAFDPPLPPWKVGPIRRLGFGTLNKVILVYDTPFWNVEQDMFGLLREPEIKNSLDQEDYVANRGRFYFFWNCIKTTGRPVLISLMAGDAAHQAEATTDAELVAEVTQELGKMFKQAQVPKPLETIVTRWGKDRFARGSYSYVGATSQPGDYEAMAAPVGTLHFAGEATCATHPATVHGAYISGLRAASEVIDDLLGPIEIPSPLVPWPSQADMDVTMTDSPEKRKADELAPNEQAPREPQEDKEARLEAFETDILQAIFAELGFRPSRPGKPGSNPFLLFTKEKWAEVKKSCDDARLASTGNPASKASRNEVRATIGLMWREGGDALQKPYVERTSSNREANREEAATFDERLAVWDARAMDVRRKYVEQHPGVLTEEEEHKMWRALGVYGDYEERRGKKVSGYAEDSDSNVEV